MVDKKIGILGGGQLGKMINLAAAPMHLNVSFLDKDKSFPVGRFTDQFFVGDYNDYDDVINFGKQVDIVGIEIEHVNINALRTLKALGKELFPDPDILDIIKNKYHQFLFYQNHSLPVAPFKLYNNVELILKSISVGDLAYPFIQKSLGFGYDGHGVAAIHSEKDTAKMLPCPCIVQDKISIQKEIAVIIARNKNGEIKHYEPVEMKMDGEVNLLDYLICPARISQKIRAEVVELARQVATKMNITGLLAVEMFLDMQDQLWINEIAPRPHNSGHHTIESTCTSQYSQYLRCLLNLPLGSTEMNSPYCIMLNLLGSDEYHGKTVYEGIEKVLHDSKVFIHLYGKNETRPKRKMGHATILCPSVEEGLSKANEIKNQLRIRS